MKKVFSSLLVLLALAAGCRAQVPPTQHSYANPTWSLPTPAAGSTWGGCTPSKPCLFQIWKESVALATSPCDPSTSANWKLAFTTAANATSWVDTASSIGGNFCYLAVTTQVGSTNSDPSNSALANVPASPLAPALTIGVTQAENVEPLSPLPSIRKPSSEVASVVPPLQFRVIVRR